MKYTPLTINSQNSEIDDSMLDFAKASLNQTSGQHIILSTALLYTAKASFSQTTGHPLILGVLALLILLHAIITSIFSTFKRDVHNKTFRTVYDAASLLSNPDSVLSRGGVRDSIMRYEKLFAGARRETGKTSTGNSIQKRAKEYQKMVNNFYDLVTDFYEWGWGQVCDVMIKITINTLTAWCFMIDRFTNLCIDLLLDPVVSLFISHLERKGSRLMNQSFEPNIT